MPQSLTICRAPPRVFVEVEGMMQNIGRVTLASLLLVVLSSLAAAQASPNITYISPISAGVGASVTITGANFGASQGSSTITFNGASATPSSWSDMAIVTQVPTGASTGDVIVTVA